MSFARIKAAMKVCGPMSKSGPPSPKVLRSTDSPMRGPIRPKMAMIKRALGLNATQAGPAAGGPGGAGGLPLPQPKPALGGPASGGLGGSPGSALGQPPVPAGANPKPPAGMSPPGAPPGMQPGPQPQNRMAPLPPKPPAAPPTDPAAFAKLMAQEPMPEAPEITLDDAMGGAQGAGANGPSMDDLMQPIPGQGPPGPQLPPNQNSQMPNAAYQQHWMNNLQNDPAASGRLRKAMGSAPLGKTELAGINKQGAAAWNRTQPAAVPSIKQPTAKTRTRERYSRRLRLPLPNEPEKFGAALVS